MAEINENLEKVYYLDKDGAKHLVDKSKETFAPIGHTHTAEEIGADKSGSAVAALTLAQQYTDEQIDNHTHTKDEITDLIDIVIDSELSAESNNPVANSAIVAGIDSAIEEVNESVASTLTSANEYTDTKVGDMATSVDEQFAEVNDELSQHMGNTTAHLTDNEKAKIEESYAHLVEGHAPINAEKNVIVGIKRNGESVTVGEDRIVDIIVPTTAEEVGADAYGSADNALAAAQAYTNTAVSGFQTQIDGHTDNVDIHFTAEERAKLAGIEEGATNYRPQKLEVSAGTYTKVTITEDGHVVDGENPTTLAGYGITDGATKQSVIDAEARINENIDSKVANLASNSSVDTKVSNHNTSTEAHNDIRILVSELSTKLNHFLDVDDETSDELSEVLQIINNNRGTLESLLDTKINVGAIVDNLTTANNSMVLSANQGVEIKKLIDDLQTAVDGKADDDHNHAATDITSGTLSSDRLPTVPVSKGGTGATNAKAAQYNLLADMNEVTSEIQDSYLVTYKYSSPSADNGGVYARPISYLWTYIKNKISSVLGLTASNYSGKAASAINADSANTATTLTGLTATVSELNKMDGVTVTYTDINKLSGLKDNIQAQLDSKSNIEHTHNYAGSSSAGGSANSTKFVQGTTDVARYIPFQDGNNSTTVFESNYDADFKYNPVTNELFAQNLKASTVTFNDTATIKYNSDTKSIDFVFN